VIPPMGNGMRLSPIEIFSRDWFGRSVKFLQHHFL